MHSDYPDGVIRVSGQRDYFHPNQVTATDWLRLLVREEAQNKKAIRAAKDALEDIRITPEGNARHEERRTNKDRRRSSTQEVSGSQEHSPEAEWYDNGRSDSRHRRDGRRSPDRESSRSRRRASRSRSRTREYTYSRRTRYQCFCSCRKNARSIAVGRDCRARTRSRPQRPSYDSSDPLSEVNRSVFRSDSVFRSYARFLSQERLEPADIFILRMLGRTMQAAFDELAMDLYSSGRNGQLLGL